MLVQKTRVGARGWRRWLGRLLVALAACILVASLGCAGPEERGDRAMAMGDVDRALIYYERAITDGSRDPQLYFRAAEAAQSQGAFAKAERYYSQSLRYGGGTEVARALAKFYISTSNFSQAARVFQYLARHEEDIQPLYTNIGTALMYAGKYGDAESYLLLAHQMAPDEPVPYVNLGVLYDRYIRNYPRAVRFYECYVEMSEDAAQVRMVRTRLREIANEGPVDTSRVHLECGEEYQIYHPEHPSLAEIFDVDTDHIEADESPVMEDDEEVSRVFEVSGEDADEEDEGEVTQVEPVIERPSIDGEELDEDKDVTEVARRLFEAGRYDEVVQWLEGRDVEDEQALKARQLLGRAYYRVGRFEDALPALEEVVEERPGPQVVEDLLRAYEQEGEGQKMESICERFSGWPDYEEALDPCH